MVLLSILGMGSLRSVCRSRSDTDRDKMEASLHVSEEAVRIALMETRREASAMRRLCKVSSILKLLTFLLTTALQRLGWVQLGVR